MQTGQTAQSTIDKKRTDLAGANECYRQSSNRQSSLIRGKGAGKGKRNERAEGKVSKDKQVWQHPMVTGC